MPKKISLISIGVSRNGQTVFTPPGKMFDFTDEELADMDKLSAETKLDYYTNAPTVEDASVEEKPAKGKKAAQTSEL